MKSAAISGRTSQEVRELKFQISGANYSELSRTSQEVRELKFNQLSTVLNAIVSHLARGA